MFSCVIKDICIATDNDGLHTTKIFVDFTVK